MPIDEIMGDQQRIDQARISSRELLVPLGNSLPNAIWRLKQVSRESSEEIMIHWDSDESGNACELVKQ